MRRAATTLESVVGLRARSADSQALRDDFGAGLGLYGRGATDTDLCVACEQGSSDPSAPAAMPYPVLRWPDAFTPAEHEALLEWLQWRERWRATDGGFYRADVFGLSDDTELPQELAAKLGSNSHWAETLAAETFSQPLRLHGPIALHRMGVGDGIGIHSDNPRPGEETHRIVITVCASLPRVAGGHFVLLAGTQPAAARVVIPLQSNAALAFQLEAGSYHAITTMREGTRFSIVMSFRRA